MLRGRDILGLPILESGSCERLCEVEELLLNKDESEIIGLLTSKKTWCSTAKYIPRKEARWEKNSFFVCCPQSAIDIDYILASKITGRKVKTTAEKIIGTVKDIIIDDDCQNVIGFEVSDGLISDIISGRRVINKRTVFSISEYAVVMPEGIGEDELSMMDQGGNVE